jgi:hypothetical protein
VDLGYRSMVGNARLSRLDLARTALGMERPRLGLAGRVLDARTGGPGSTTGSRNAAGNTGTYRAAATRANSTGANGTGASTAFGAAASSAAAAGNAARVAAGTGACTGTTIAEHLTVTARFVRRDPDQADSAAAERDAAWISRTLPAAVPRSPCKHRDRHAFAWRRGR